MELYIKSELIRQLHTGGPSGGKTVDETPTGTDENKVTVNEVRTDEAIRKKFYDARYNWLINNYIPANEFVIEQSEKKIEEFDKMDIPNAQKVIDYQKAALSYYTEQIEQEYLKSFTDITDAADIEKRFTVKTSNRNYVSYANELFGNIPLNQIFTPTGDYEYKLDIANQTPERNTLIQPIDQGLIKLQIAKQKVLEAVRKNKMEEIKRLEELEKLTIDKPDDPKPYIELFKFSKERWINDDERQSIVSKLSPVFKVKDEFKEDVKPSSYNVKKETLQSIYIVINLFIVNLNIDNKKALKEYIEYSPFVINELTLTPDPAIDDIIPLSLDDLNEDETALVENENVPVNDIIDKTEGDKETLSINIEESKSDDEIKIDKTNDIVEGTVIEKFPITTIVRDVTTPPVIPPPLEVNNNDNNNNNNNNNNNEEWTPIDKILPQIEERRKKKRDKLLEFKNSTKRFNPAMDYVISMNRHNTLGQNKYLLYFEVIYQVQHNQSEWIKIENEQEEGKYRILLEAMSINQDRIDRYIDDTRATNINISLFAIELFENFLLPYHEEPNELIYDTFKQIEQIAISKNYYPNDNMLIQTRALVDIISEFITGEINACEKLYKIYRWKDYQLSYAEKPNFKKPVPNITPIKLSFNDDNNQSQSETTFRRPNLFLDAIGNAKLKKTAENKDKTPTSTEEKQISRPQNFLSELTKMQKKIAANGSTVEEIEKNLKDASEEKKKQFGPNTKSLPQFFENLSKNIAIYNANENAKAQDQKNKSADKSATPIKTGSLCLNWKPTLVL